MGDWEGEYLARGIVRARLFFRRRQSRTTIHKSRQSREREENGERDRGKEQLCSFLRRLIFGAVLLQESFVGAFLDAFN